jgi:hypothetical protein
MKAGLNGSSPTPVATNQPDPRFIAADANNVYWRNGFATSIYWVNAGSGTIMHLAK